MLQISSCDGTSSRRLRVRNSTLEHLHPAPYGSYPHHLIRLSNTFLRSRSRISPPNTVTLCHVIRTLHHATRLSNILAQALSAERVVPDGVPEENDDLIKAEIFRGAGPKYTDAPGFHLFNVVVHAAACASSTWLFRCVFAGKAKLAAIGVLYSSTFWPNYF